MFCSNCGSLVNEGNVYCGNCGHRISMGPQPQSISDGNKASNGLTNNESETPVHIQDGFEPITLPEQQTLVDSRAQQDALNGMQAGQSAILANSSGLAIDQEAADTTKESGREGFLSNENLWTWLKKDERRQLFYVGDREQLTESEYMDLIAQKLRENEVPATIEQREICWDNGNEKTSSFFVRPTSTAVNPLACMLHFANVGRFSFVEQKTFVCPPNLPPYPGTKMDLPDSSGVGRFFIGIMIALISAFLFETPLRSIAGAGVIVGIVLILIGIPAFSKQQEAISHNMLCEKQERAYNKAWKDWEDTVFLHSFQESTNGKISRIYQAVFESIRQVNTAQFKDIEPTDEREDMSMVEMRQQISNLKESYR